MFDKYNRRGNTEKQLEKLTMKAGASEAVITPPVGLTMTGMAKRIAGDKIARYVHDDLYVKALCLESENGSMAVAVLDIGGIDAVFTSEVRKAVEEKAGLKQDSIMVSATHCHSSSAIRPVAVAYSDENIGISSSGMTDGSWGSSEVKPALFGNENISSKWRKEILGKTINTIVDAWENREEAI